MDNSTALRSLYRSLERPPSDGTYAAFPVPSAPDYRLAMTFEGRPCLMVTTSRATHSVTLADLVGEHVRVLHGRRCEVLEHDGRVWSDEFTLVICSSDDVRLQGYFLDVVETLIALLGQHPTEANLREAMHGLLELFRTLRAPARKTARGLWAEMLVVCHASDPTGVLAAWHPDFEEPFDFGKGVQRVEVKSASDRSRRHHFALAQLSPPIGTEVVVVSVFVVPAAGGPSIRDLMVELKTIALHIPELQNRVDRVVAQALGDSLLSSVDLRFDRELAIDSLQFYHHETIPAIHEVPLGVTDVRFMSDLSHCLPMALARLKGYGALFASVCP